MEREEIRNLFVTDEKSKRFFSQQYLNRCLKTFLKNIKNRIHLSNGEANEAERWLTDYFRGHYQQILDRLEEGVQSIEQIAETTFPEALVVNGEGVSYCGIDAFSWEESCPEYWQMLEKMVLRYRKAGLWGSVVRTSCEPADPVWYSHPEKLLHINRLFLDGKDE